MEKNIFGKLTTGEEIYSYKLENSKIYAEIITYGARLRAFGRIGRDNIVGSFDTIEDYTLDDSFQGAIIGRIADRTANARFTIDGVEYKLPKNAGNDCIHSGGVFSRSAWKVEKSCKDSITLSYFSPDGECGFPGDLRVYVTYSLDGEALIIDYKAYPEKKTPISMTNHAYFNLYGMGGNIYSHEVTLYADKYSAIDKNLLPTGEHPSVDGTPLDLRKPKILGNMIQGDFLGYDHNFCLSPLKYREFLGKNLGLAAEVKANGLCLSVYTDMHDLVFYTANELAGFPNFRCGIKRINHGALCLEAETEPNAVNFGLGIYDAGEVYKQTTVYELKEVLK